MWLLSDLKRRKRVSWQKNYISLLRTAERKYSSAFVKMTMKFIIRLYRIDHVMLHIYSLNLGPNIAINTRLFMETAANFSTYKSSSLGYIVRAKNSSLRAGYFCSKCALESLVATDNQTK